MGKIRSFFLIFSNLTHILLSQASRFGRLLNYDFLTWNVDVFINIKDQGYGTLELWPAKTLPVIKEEMTLVPSGLFYYLNAKK